MAPVGDRCGEGAVWCAEEGAVYWTDINRFLIHRYRLDDAAVHSWLFDEPVVALALTAQAGTLLAALGSRLIFWTPATDAREEQGFGLPGWPQVRLNDGRADPLGNFWVGSMRNNVLPDGEPGEAGGQDGVLHRIAPDGTVSEWRRGIGIANTLCWSPDHRRFYSADTLANRIFAYDFDAATGSIANERPFLADYGRGLPDGSAIDAAGQLWNCRFGGRCIVRVAPDGQIAGTVEMPVQNPTTCIFGGEDLRTLFITTAGVPARAGDRLAGGLFALRVEVPGMPENRFGGRQEESSREGDKR